MKKYRINHHDKEFYEIEVMSDDLIRVTQFHSNSDAVKNIKTVRVYQDCGFTYKLLKTKILARDGADGLFEFIKDCYENKFMECNANKVIAWIINDMKGAK